jgi:alpha-galactosidase
MQRRSFIKLSATAAVATLFNQLGYAADMASDTVLPPAEVWAQTGGQWFRLKNSNGLRFTSGDIEVSLKGDGQALQVFAQSPTKPLNALRLTWKHTLPQGTKVLGDHWERSYGDLSWKTPDAQIKNPWYILLNSGSQTAGFGVKTGCNTICWWAVTPESLSLTLDTASAGVGVKLGYRTLHAADVVSIKSLEHETPFALYKRFCRMMCPTARLPKQPVYGINDWYFAYGNNSAALIKETTARMAALATNAGNRPFSVIDAGWAAYAPALPGDCCWFDDFSRPNDKFKDMELMADDIKKLGMRPGLWTRPLCASYKDSHNLLLPSIPGRDNPRNPILDPTIDENLERVKQNITIYKQWGYELVKHDFSTYDITGKWGFEMRDALTMPGWRFYDESKTTAEVINNLYKTIRDAAGEMYVNGCNTMSHLAAGIFESNRTGDDTSGKEWGRTLKMGVNTLAFRIAQHDIFYAVDADCVGLTHEVPWEKNKQWMQLLVGSGTPLFISAQPDALGEEQHAYIKLCFCRAATKQPAGEPLDWMTNQTPERWVLDGREVTFKWH